MSVYPNEPWQLWRFGHITSQFWKDIHNRRQYFDWLSRELDIQHFEDWYRVKVVEIKSKQGAHGMLSYYSDSLTKALVDVYPEFKWKLWKFSRTLPGYWKDI